MITLPVIISLIFFSSFALYLFAGVYIFFLNQASLINIVFLLMCLSLCVWLFTVKHYDLMKSGIKFQTSKEGQILNETSRSKLYCCLSLSYILGSFMNIISFYFIYRASLSFVLLFSVFLCLFGIAVQLLNHIKIKEDYRDWIVFFLISVSIPLITLRFIEYASITVWAVPAIFLMLSVLFNNTRRLILLSFAIIFTLVWVWIKKPLLMVQVDASDHLTRIFIFAILIFLTFYVNRIFIYRLNENENQNRFHKMIAQISAVFITISEANANEIIKNMLQTSGKQFQVDSAYLFLSSRDQKTMTCTHEWCNDDIAAACGSLGEVTIDPLSWWMKQTLNSNEACVLNVDMLPSEADKEKELLKNQQVKTLLTVPVTNKGKVLGFLGFKSVKNAKTWPDDQREITKILANILGDALTKVAAEKEIKYLAFYDTLTGLANRKLFVNRLTKEIDLAKRIEKLIGVIYLDLDYFKTFNDTMGHESGDELLKQVAAKLSENVRKHDTVSRFGGDEFLIMLTNIARVEDITRIADAIIKTFEHPLIVKGQEFFVTTSAGIAIYPTDGEESGELIKNADMSMYISKAQGKNKYTFCSPLMRDDALNKMKLTNNLYRAQERNELVLYYQPQVSVVTKNIIGAEALIRWKHPDMGMISPSVFIPLAEKTGLINPIGDWVLFTACRQNMEWHKLGLPPIRMAVNMSVEQFRNPNLVSSVSRVLSETGLRPEYLELEITESTAIKESNYIIRVLEKLKNLGVSIAIDDFGTEYSSLSRLKMLPIDRIKMDMQFVKGISKDQKDEAIAKVIIQLARNLSLKVIAEGVETAQQLDYLTNQVCDEVQGYYYYEPMPAKEIETILWNQYNHMRIFH